MSAVKPAPEKGGRSEGTWGEALAAEYLRQRGCRLAAHSYHCRFGEIDLIAWDGSSCASWRSRPAPTRTWVCPGSM